MILKKILIYLCCLLVMFNVVSYRAYATTDYQVYIAVICEDEARGRGLIGALCSSKSEVVYPSDSKFTGEKNKCEDSTIIYDRDFDINYHVRFYYMSSRLLDRKAIDKCSGVIILYDISDAALDPIVQSSTFYRDDLEHLVSSFKSIPLIRDIVDLQYGMKGCFGFFWRGWYNAISFATYNGDKLEPEEYEKRHEKLNAFTCALEKYYDVDNKWNRGHPDLSNDCIYRRTLYWIAGQAGRSIRSGFLRGSYDFADDESRGYISPV